MLLVGLLVVAGVMISGPLSSYLNVHGQRQQLREQRAALREEIARLEARRQTLKDPEQVQLMAREQLGLVRPGEVPYVIIAPDQPLRADFGRHTGDPLRGHVPAEVRSSPTGATPWYQRVWKIVSGLLAG